MGKRSTTFTLVACLGAGAILSAAPAASASSSDESCFVASINAERASIGRRALAVKGDLVAVARRHSARMAEDETIYHNKNLPNEVGGNWYALGENVGMGPTCDALHQAFMSSPAHRANILDKDYNQIGVGVVVRDGTIYVTEVFAGRPSAATRSRTKAAAPPKPAPPKPKPPEPKPRTIQFLLLLIGLDAQRTDPVTGAALGV